MEPTLCLLINIRGTLIGCSITFQTECIQIDSLHAVIVLINLLIALYIISEFLYGLNKFSQIH